MYVRVTKCGRCLTCNLCDNLFMLIGHRMNICYSYLYPTYDCIYQIYPLNKRIENIDFSAIAKIYVLYINILSNCASSIIDLQ